MRELFKIGGFTPYIIIIFLNAMTDLGHKIVLQNTILKSYDGADLIILTAIINALILLPFILLFSKAGFLSDRYAKRDIIKISSFFAIIITIAILISYIMGWFWVAFGLTFILAGQSAIYSPAKYGLIKEMTEDKQLTLANSLVQSITIISILAGTVIYSIFFESLLPNGVENKSEILQYIYPLGFALIFASILEFIFSLKLIKELDSKPIKVVKAKEIGVKENISILKERDGVWLSIIGLSIFWGLSQLVIAIFGAYLKRDMGIDDTVIANGILSLSGIGIIIGSLLVSRFSKNYIEIGIIPVGIFGIALTLLFVTSANSILSLSLLFFFYGVSSGFLIIPLNTLIQALTPQPVMGRVLAGNNLMQNIVMFSFLSITTIFAYIGIDSSHLFSIASIISFIGFIYSLKLLAPNMIRFLVRISFGLFYNIDVKGLDNIDKDKGILLLGNHISFLDWAFLQIAYPQQIRFVIDREYYNLWYLKPIFKFFGAIPISSRGGKRALALVGDALNRGETVALFPEGHLTRNGHLGKFQKGFELAVTDVSNAVIIPFYLRGLWEGRFSHASDKIKDKKLKDIGVYFGKPLDIKSSTREVKDEVFKLSIESWNAYVSRLPSLAKSWIVQAKRVGKDLSIADSTGVELSGYRFITAVLLMRRAFKNILDKHEQNVGLIVPTSVGGSIANMATLTLGKTIVNLNYSSGASSLKHALKMANIKQVITSKQFMIKLKAKGFDLEDALDGIELIYLETLKSQMSKGLQLRTFLIAKFMPTFLLSLCYVKRVSTLDTTAILFSSGSEGRPKGIELSHQNIMGNIKQFINLINPNKNDVMLGTLPIFHSFGLTVTTLAPLIEGIPVVCHPDPTDGLGIAKMSFKYRATFLFATATFFRLYARNRKIHPLMFANLRMAIAGAEKLPKEIRELFLNRFGKSILEGYGTTETTPVISCNIDDAIVPNTYHVQVGNKYGTVGLPILGTSFKIVDPNSFEPLKVGEAGMVLVGGLQVMKGYLKDSKKTKEVIKEIDGIRWYITGDKGYLDEDGFLTIVDRYSRFAKVGGEMVSLGLVESQIGKLLGEDSQIAITAIPDIKKGEKIVALLEGDKDLDVLREEVKALNLNPLFLPSSYYKVDSIPKLGTGKADFNGAKVLALKLNN